MVHLRHAQTQKAGLCRDRRDSSGLRRVPNPSVVPPHEVVLLARVLVPHRDVHEASLLVVEVEVKLLPPLGVQRFGNGLRGREETR